MSPLLNVKGRYCLNRLGVIASGGTGSIRAFCLWGGSYEWPELDIEKEQQWWLCLCKAELIVERERCCNFVPSSRLARTSPDDRQWEYMAPFNTPQRVLSGFKERPESLLVQGDPRQPCPEPHY